MKVTTLLATAAFSLTALPSGAAVLWADNFNDADNNSLDAASALETAGRRTGTVASDIQSRSFGFQQNISNSQLLMPTGTNGVRFENNAGPFGAANRYDWAGGSAGAAILGAGGFVVSFDWIPVENTLGDWISFQVGTINADNGNLTDDDYGILFRNNGGTERFDNTVNLGAGGPFAASAGGLVRQVEISYAFTSFADGSSVTATSTVDGTQVASDSFTWDTNAGAMRMEMGHNAANTRVDNLSISTIPEPSAAALFGLGVFGLLARRRR